MQWVLLGDVLVTCPVLSYVCSEMRAIFPHLNSPYSIFVYFVCSIYVNLRLSYSKRDANMCEIESSQNIYLITFFRATVILRPIILLLSICCAVFFVGIKTNSIFTLVLFFNIIFCMQWQGAEPYLYRHSHIDVP